MFVNTAFAFTFDLCFTTTYQSRLAIFKRANLVESVHPHKEFQIFPFQILVANTDF